MPRFIITSILLTLALQPFVNTTTGADQPNILLIVSDDHGYADVGFHGCRDIPTPHLDQLASGGIRCSNGYVSHPFCSPTRAGLMTGRYQHRFGHENNPFYDPNDHKEGLPLTETLLPAHLAKAGYATGWVGKWHLGAAPEFRPENRGFSDTFGFIGGGHKFQNWTVDPKVEYTVPIERNGKPEQVKEHLTTVFGREAARFVKKHRDKPWFLYLAFNAPHTPHEPTEERLARFASIENPVRRKYAAQVSLMDDAIGEALSALKETEQESNTLVFFFSDNGGPISVNGSRNDPLRGAKGELFEGGMRVPFLVKWPAKLNKPGVYHEPVSSLDVFATSLAVAGVPMPGDKTYDSVNLIPFLTGEKAESPHEYLFWRTTRKLWAIRKGDWKLLRGAGPSDQLFNLKTDIGEKQNLKDSHGKESELLADELNKWNETLVKPAFSGGAARQPAKKAAKKAANKAKAKS